jgi:hypothetical protein
LSATPFRVPFLIVTDGLEAARVTEVQAKRNIWDNIVHLKARG